MALRLKKRRHSVLIQTPALLNSIVFRALIPFKWFWSTKCSSPPCGKATVSSRARNENSQGPEITPFLLQIPASVSWKTDFWLPDALTLMCMKQCSQCAITYSSTKVTALWRVLYSIHVFTLAKHKEFSSQPLLGKEPETHHSSIKQALSHQRDTHPDKVHFCAALHESPDLRAELFPHAFQIMKQSQFLESLIHLESGGEPGRAKKEKRYRLEKCSCRIKRHSITAALFKPFQAPRSACLRLDSNTQGWRTGPQQSALARGRLEVLTLWKSHKSQEYT